MSTGDDSSAMLPDGGYDAFVVDVAIDEPSDATGGERITRLELTITMGEHKGEVVMVSARGIRGEEFELIGMPATLIVRDGVPRVAFD
jgi:hypothetical protein